MKRLSSWLIDKSSGWISLLAVVVFVLFTALVLPGQSNNAELARLDESGQALGSPDTSLYYSAAQLYRIANAYGPEGRQAYIQARISFDIIWPLVYTFFLLTALSYLGKMAFPSGSPWRLANLLPLGGLLFDYLENISTSVVMARYPLATPLIAELAGVFTLLKWLFLGVSFLVLVVWLLLAVWLKFSDRK